jgi:hypothetical protein
VSRRSVWSHSAASLWDDCHSSEGSIVGHTRDDSWMGRTMAEGHNKVLFVVAGCPASPCHMYNIWITDCLKQFAPSDTFTEKAIASRVKVQFPPLGKRREPQIAAPPWGRVFEVSFRDSVSNTGSCTRPQVDLPRVARTTAGDVTWTSDRRCRRRSDGHRDKQAGAVKPRPGRRGNGLNLLRTHAVISCPFEMAEPLPRPGPNHARNYDCGISM